VDVSNVVEKEELVKTLLDSGGSSDAACSICCEDYAAGDVLRHLRCGHGFHLVRNLASAVQRCVLCMHASGACIARTRPALAVPDPRQVRFVARGFRISRPEAGRA